VGAPPPSGVSIPPPPSRTSSSGVGTVAFLGLGGMGAPMAMNVARRGFALQVWNRTRERAAGLTTLGAKLKMSPRECVEGARIVVTMVADERALTDLLAGPNGVLAGLEKDAVLVDMSTIGRAAALRVAQDVRAVGARFIDAPVSGSPGPAESGELVALVGGKLNDITRAQPVLMAMCKRLLHAGDVGQGQALKVLMNGIALQQAVALASMIALGEKAGVPRRTLLEAFTTGAVATPTYTAKREKLLGKDFTPDMTLEMALKDARLNVELQKEVGLPIAVHHEIVRTLEKAVEEGLGPEDAYAIEKYFKL